MLKIPYGKKGMLWEGPKRPFEAILRPREVKGGSELRQRALVQAALDNPIQSAPLRELSREKRRVLVITSDHTRPVPSRITLPLLLAEIRRGNPAAEIRILVATGTHRPMTTEEMRRKFGEKIVSEETVVNHQCDDAESMVHKGILPSGGELYLNRLVDWAELLVAEGFIEPHFFAGFSGGRKSVLPGIGGRKSILYNHNALFIQNPCATQGCLEGNPLHRDMCFAARAADLAFILNVILDPEKRIVNAFAGDPAAAHEEGCRVSLARVFVPRVEGDIVITSNGGYPLDQNVYQSVKGMTAAEACVRPGGVIIMCAALGDGAGGDSFYRWFADAPDPEAVAKAIEGVPPEDTREDQWEAQILARVMGHARVVFVTGEENRRLIEEMHMTWAGSLKQALDIAEAITGHDARIVLIPDGVGVVIDRHGDLIHSSAKSANSKSGR